LAALLSANLVTDSQFALAQTSYTSWPVASDPNGYNDATHAEQRMASEFAAIAVGNIVTEFEPEWGPWAKKLRVPKILPARWVPQHPHHP
jgi:hypothetical protein